ncbi:MAG: response regulator, partial [Myxococcaceae bacterium]
MTARILICDDEELIRFSLSEYFSLKGYQTVQAEDGWHCLDLLSKTRFDLVLLDLKMPRMDGLTALRKLREKDHDVPVIVITGNADIESAVLAMQYKAATFIQKPFDLAELFARCQALINEYAAQRR